MDKEVERVTRDGGGGEVVPQQKGMSPIIFSGRYYYFMDEKVEAQRG